ncbi:hypothetical protein VNO77_42612 [Canavalia gladiata]|uniref:Uncharacterized protein n=1 Tax=Canavalia gladiata TaxID=3824 RepID=A0AAN9JSK7_CANGL
MSSTMVLYGSHSLWRSLNCTLCCAMHMIGFFGYFQEFGVNTLREEKENQKKLFCIAPCMFQECESLQVPLQVGKMELQELPFSYFLPFLTFASPYG